MKEVSLLYSAPMARAMVREINRKTQTRRMPAAHNCLVDGHGMSAKRWAAMQFDWASAWLDHGGECVHAPSLAPDNRGTVHRITPRAEAGDVMWGRETWRTVFLANDVKPSDVHPAYRVWYEADQPLQPGYGKCRTAIHMPRWASRIVRPIVCMRFERLQDISGADAKAEGCDHNDPCDHVRLSCKEIGCSGPDYRVGYRKLWDQINGPGSWEKNPMVLVYEFGIDAP